jgi:Cu-Zn family superoxide dismutase
MKRASSASVSVAVIAMFVFLGIYHPSSSAAKKESAVAVLESRSSSSVTGKATFTQKGDSVEAVVEVKGAKPGQHGLHLHETGDCSAPDAKSAGGHFNPDNKAHGAPEQDPHHAGDMGNLTVGQNGTGKLKVMLKGQTVASIKGRALVVHGDPDDYKTQPSGNSGARVACGVVK